MTRVPWTDLEPVPEVTQGLYGLVVIVQGLVGTK